MRNEENTLNYFIFVLEKNWYVWSFSSAGKNSSSSRTRKV